MSEHTLKYQAFKRLHESFFVLPTIWDPLSAVSAQAAGYEAVATSSASVGFGLGRFQSEPLNRDEMLAEVAAIVRATRLPVSVDLEAGYPDAVGDIRYSISALLRTGAIAINIEDNPGNHHAPLVPIERHQEKIAAARAVSEAAGLPLFINARTDAFGLKPALSADDALTEVILRGRAYAEAGADGLYVMAGDLPEAAIKRLSDEVPLPLTLRAPRKSGAFSHWQALGVRRLSLGTYPIRQAFAHLTDNLAGLRASGQMDYSEQNASPSIETLLENGRTF